MISDVYQADHNINIMNKNAIGQSKLKSHCFQAVMKSAPLSVGTNPNNLPSPSQHSVHTAEN